MTTIIVTTNTEQALLTAIADASDGDTIAFSVSGTISLTRTLTLSKNITIEGAAAGGGNVTLLGSGSFTDMTITALGSVTLADLVIAGGAGTGTAGAAGTAGTPSGGNGGDAAGGVFNFGSALTARNIVFHNDTATGGAGGTGYSWRTFDGVGGGGGGGGGSAASGIFNESGNVSFENLSYNNVSAVGGAGGDGGSGAGAMTPPANFSLNFGGAGGNGGFPDQDGIDGQNGNAPGGSSGAFGGAGGVTAKPDGAWTAAPAGATGDPGTGLEGRGGGGGGGGGGGTSFQTAGGNGSLVPACFLRGTHIRTERGEVRIEDIVPGEDWAITASGHAAKIIWVGRRHAKLRCHPRPWDVMPIRIRAEAFGPDLPVRDLVVSPDHALLQDGALIPARLLINGATVVQEPHDTATWYHIELEWHEAILAENLATESYLDTGNRHAFDNAGLPLMLHADFVANSDAARQIWAEHGMGPITLEGDVVVNARIKLFNRATELGFVASSESNVYLQVDGRQVWPIKTGNTLNFQLPANARRIHLCSYATACADINSHSTDRRRLGVAVAELSIDETIIRANDILRGHGWYTPESFWQWTDGSAELQCAGARRISVTLVDTGLMHWQHRGDALATIDPLYIEM